MAAQGKLQVLWNVQKRYVKRQGAPRLQPDATATLDIVPCAKTTEPFHVTSPVVLLKRPCCGDESRLETVDPVRITPRKGEHGSCRFEVHLGELSEKQMGTGRMPMHLRFFHLELEAQIGVGAAKKTTAIKSTSPPFEVWSWDRAERVDKLPSNKRKATATESTELEPSRKPDQSAARILASLSSETESDRKRTMMR